MGFAYLIVGCFFLLNPTISLIDLLPDCIGYALIMKGLNKVSKLSVDFESAYRSFRTLLFFSLAKLVTLPLMGGDDQTWVLVMVFCFGLIEGFLSLRAFNAMFEGFCYTAERGESRSVFTKWSETKLLTIIFVIARQALCILPELSLLSSTEYGVVTTNGINSLAQYRLIFNLFAAIISLAFGIFWFIRIRSYLKNVRNDKLYVGMLEERYQTLVGENSSALLHYAMRFSLGILSVAAILSTELPFDGFNYLPHAVSALLILIAARSLIAYFKSEAGKTVRWSLIYTIVSAVVWIYNLVYMRIIFGSMFDSTDEGLALSYAEVLKIAVQKDFFALDGFIVLCVLTLAEAILFAIVVRHLTALLKAVLLHYTPKKEENKPEDDEYAEWKDLLPQDKQLAPKRSYLRITIMQLLGWASAILTPIQIALSFLFPDFWLFAFIVRILWVLSFYLTVSKAKELEQEANAMLEDTPPSHDMVR